MNNARTNRPAEESTSAHWSLKNNESSSILINKRTFCLLDLMRTGDSGRQVEPIENLRPMYSSHVLPFLPIRKSQLVWNHRLLFGVPSWRTTEETQPYYSHLWRVFTQMQADRQPEQCKHTSTGIPRVPLPLNYPTNLDSSYPLCKSRVCK